MVIQWLLLTFGLFLLWGGAELLIRNGARLARILGISPIVIGLTVISVGTSLPEFVVSFIAALKNTMGISIGNIIGSNIANIGLILGVGAILTTLNVEREWIKMEIPLMILFTIIFSIFARTGYLIQRWEGIVLVIFLVLFMIYLFKSSGEAGIPLELEEEAPPASVSLGLKIKLAFLTLLGVGVLILGSKMTVDAAQQIARAFGISEAVIGLSLVALGTSLPELATTIVGIIRKENDLVVGNIIGSNIFNLLFIGGVVSIIRPIDIDINLFRIEFPFLLAVSILLWPLMYIGLNLKRLEGVLLLILYFVFIGLIYTI
ncbi:MAG: calcium/sodium antiporter [Calditrichia bacterium]